jgi:hypothetical protein
MVMDTLFLEVLQFQVRRHEFAHCAIAPSREEVLRLAMALVGIELIDYGSFVTQPILGRQTGPDTAEAWTRIIAFSKAYRERAERATASR